MRQAVLKDSCKFAIEEMPNPELVPETLLLKVKYTSICGSDTRYQGLPVQIDGIGA